MEKLKIKVSSSAKGVPKKRPLLIVVLSLVLVVACIIILVFITFVNPKINPILSVQLQAAHSVKGVSYDCHVVNVTNRKCSVLVNVDEQFTTEDGNRVIGILRGGISGMVYDSFAFVYYPSEVDSSTKFYTPYLKTAVSDVNDEEVFGVFINAIQHPAGLIYVNDNQLELSSSSSTCRQIAEFPVSKYTDYFFTKVSSADAPSPYVSFRSNLLSKPTFYDLCTGLIKFAQETRYMYASNGNDTYLVNENSDLSNKKYAIDTMFVSNNSVDISLPHYFSADTVSKEQIKKEISGIFYSAGYNLETFSYKN